MVGVDRQLAVNLPSGRSLVIGLARNRYGRDFSEGERTLAEALRPHLIRARENAVAVTRTGISGKAVVRAFQHLAAPVAILDRGGCVLLATEAASQLAFRCAGDTRSAGKALPDDFRRWLSHAVRLQLEDCPLERAGLPLICGHGTRSLGVRLVTLADERCLALFETCAGDTPAALHLSPRQHEVLCLAAEGLLDKEIGALLQISPRTVQKHLEAVYTILGVHTRTAAARWAGRWGHSPPESRASRESESGRATAFSFAQSGAMPHPPGAGIQGSRSAPSGRSGSSSRTQMT